MALVQLPDGTLAHFADGVSPEELRKYVIPDLSDAMADPGPLPGDDLVPFDIAVPGMPMQRPSEPEWDFHPYPERDDGGVFERHIRDLLAEQAAIEAQLPSRELPSDRPETESTGEQMLVELPRRSIPNPADKHAQTTLAEFREQYPAYADLSDDDLADALFSQYYADTMPRGEFDVLVDYAPSPQRRYDNALAKLRELRFPNRSDEWWEEYSSHLLAPNINTQRDHATLLGFSDELSAAMSGGMSQIENWLGFDAPTFSEVYPVVEEFERAKVELAREQNGLLGGATEVLGSLASLGPARTGAGQLARFAIGSAQPATRTGSQIVNFAKSAAAPVTVGAIEGVGSADGDLADRALGGIFGGGIGLLGAAVAEPAARTVEALARKAAGIPAWLANNVAVSQAVKAAPTAAAIKAGSEAAYSAAADSGALITPKAMGQLRQKIMERLGYHGMVLRSGKLSTEYSKVADAVEALDELALGNASVAEVQTLLRRLRRVEKSADADEAQIGRELVEQLEDFMGSLPPSAVAKGNGQMVAQQWAKGRSDLVRGDKVGTIEEAIENASIAADGFVKGLKDEFRSILKSAERKRRFSTDELAQLRRFIEGGPVPNFVASIDPSAVANMLGQVTGVPGGGFTTGAAGMAAGAGARHLSDVSARRAAERLRAAAATPGGLPQLPAPLPPSDFPGIGVPAALVLSSEPLRDEVLRLLVQE